MLMWALAWAALAASGVVNAQDGQPVAGATVTVYAAGGRFAATTTDSTGHFVLPFGGRFVVEHEGYASAHFCADEPVSPIELERNGNEPQVHPTDPLPGPEIPTGPFPPLKLPSGLDLAEHRVLSADPSINQAVLRAAIDVAAGRACPDVPHPAADLEVRFTFLEGEIVAIEVGTTGADATSPLRACLLRALATGVDRVRLPRGSGGALVDVAVDPSE